MTEGEFGVNQQAIPKFMLPDGWFLANAIRTYSHDVSLHDNQYVVYLGSTGNVSMYTTEMVPFYMRSLQEHPDDALEIRHVYGHRPEIGWILACGLMKNADTVWEEYSEKYLNNDDK